SVCAGPSSLIVWLCCFFFFQAEDGIRDKLVTGVQTCALPIFCCCTHSSEPVLRREWLSSGTHVTSVSAALDGPELDPETVRAGRSEERRVGKECRSRWSARADRENTRGSRSQRATTAD